MCAIEMRSDDIHPGDVIAGKYRVRAILSRAPTFIVDAFHVEFDQRTVIKLLLPGTGDEKEIERFRREARVLSKLETEHAARILDVGTQQDGSFYLARQHVEGEDLATYVRTYGARPLPEAILLTLQAAECVAETHAHGIILRELSPQNIVVARRAGGSPSIKITDFGTAKLMRDASAPAGEGSLTATALFGLSSYSSPELVRKAKTVDQRADVWSLGAVLYFLLAGKAPFTGDMAQLMLAITREEPRPLTSLRGDLSPEIDNIMAWALAKDLDRRFKDVHSLAHALAPYAPQEGKVLVQRIAQITQLAKHKRTGGSVLPPPPSFQPPPPSSSGAASNRPPGYASGPPPIPPIAPPPPAPADLAAAADDMVGEDEATVVLGGAKLREITDRMPGLAIPPPPPSLPPSPWLPTNDRMPRLIPPVPSFTNRRAPIPSSPDSGPGLAYARHDTVSPATLGRGGSVLPPPRRGFDVRILWGALAATAVMAPVVVLLLVRDVPAPSPSVDPAAAQTDPSRARDAKQQDADPAAPAVTLEAAPARPDAPPSPDNAQAQPPRPTGPLPPRPPRDRVDPKRDDPKKDRDKKDDPKSDDAGGGTGRLLAIASGGSCAFSVDGSARGSGSSLSVSLPAGNHTVVCKPTSGAAKSRSVSIKKDQTSMLTFKL
jgi:serine/threonine-protein kinase